MVGKGDDTLLWFDKWVGPAPLKNLFPKLYCLERRKQCKVEDRVSSFGYSWDWSAVPSADSQM